MICVHVAQARSTNSAVVNKLFIKINSIKKMLTYTCMLIFLFKM